MKTRIVYTLIIVLLLIIALTIWLGGSAQAMNSSNFRVDWFTPATTNGGGPASSTSYSINYTIGQTVIGTASSTNFQVQLGFWYGATTCYLLPCKLSLPLIVR